MKPTLESEDVKGSSPPSYCPKRKQKARIRSTYAERSILRTRRQNIIRDKGIGLALIAELAGRAVAGYEGHVVAQRPELLGDRIDQVLMIAARKVGATDRALKQDVADHRQLGRLMVKNHVTRRVAGAVNDVEHEIADRHLIAIDQPPVRHEAFRLHTIAGTITIELIDPEQIILVRALDRNTKFFRKHSRLSAMIKMAVGDDDLFQINAMLLDRRLETRQVATGIAERRLVRLGAPEERAILLERGDRNDHGLEWCFCHVRLFGDNAPKLQAVC